MSARAHAAGWIVAIAVAWLLVGEGPNLAHPRSATTAPDAIARIFVAMMDVHAMRLWTNVMHTVQQLRSWADLAPAWAPVILAGVLDGVAQRRARRCSLEPAPDVGLLLGRHALVALGFAPVLWVSCASDVDPWIVESWTIALSLSMSFTLSRVQGLGLRA